MIILSASISVLFVACFTLFCNSYLIDYNIHLFFSGVVIRFITEFLDVIPASLLLIFSGWLMDSINFVPRFGDSAIIYLLFYGIYRYMLANNVHYAEKFGTIVVQILNFIFILYACFVNFENFSVSVVILAIVFSQVMVYFLEIILFKINLWVAQKKDKNPFHVAQDFFKNSGS